MRANIQGTIERFNVTEGIYVAYPSELSDGDRNVVERIEKWIASIKHSLVSAEVHFNIYWSIQEFRGRDYGTKTLNQAPGFWMATIDAHRDRGIMLLWRILVDTENNSRSIPNLIEYISRVPHVFTRQMFQLRIGNSEIAKEFVAAYMPPDMSWRDENLNLLDQIKVDLDSLTKWRHLFVAHADQRVVERKFNLSEQARLDRDSLSVLLDAARSLINSVTLKFDCSEWTPGAAPSDIRHRLEMLLERESSSRDNDS